MNNGLLQTLILGSLICRCWYAHVLGQTFPTNLTVAQDGSGDFRTINEALRATPNNSDTRFYIKIKAGVYRETLMINAEKARLTLVGDGMTKTLIVGNKSKGGGFDTYDTVTTGIKGEQFAAIDITFENDAGPQNMQAVALRSEVDSAFYRCRFLGFQDTLLAMYGRQFYRECHIYGTVDFIWGNAKVVFQKSVIFARNPLPNQYNTITAQGRSDPKGKEGTVLHDCYINGSEGFKKTIFKTYLGRPWRTYSRVILIKTYISDLVDPIGWVVWDNSTQLNKTYYAEFQNYGPGNETNRRAVWPGVKRSISYREAALFSVRNFINGTEWLPSTKIPFVPDLM